MDFRSLQIDFPVDLVQEISLEDLQRLTRETLYVRLCEQGKISSGRAGTMLGISRSDFLDLLGRYGVSYFDAQTDLADDVRNAQRAHPSSAWYRRARQVR
jgi:predicted HTH domain antitoxin